MLPKEVATAVGRRVAWPEGEVDLSKHVRPAAAAAVRHGDGRVHRPHAAMGCEWW